jgi:hypothetical protein
MKRIFFTGICIVASLQLLAQDPTIQDLKKEMEKTIEKDPTDTIPRKWKKGGLFNLNINQGSLSNWSAGGDEFSFSLNASLNVYAFYKKDKKSWDNSLDLAFGMVNTTSLGNRKSSDRIDFTSKYGYALKKKLNLAALTNVRSQFANGYSYLSGSAGQDSSSITSKAFMPTYVLVSLGLDYKPTDNFSLFVSPTTARWVIVGDDALAPLYGVPFGKNAKSEFGAFASANLMQKIGENLTFKSKLDLFSNYKSNPQNVDIFWSNIIAAKLTKYINFTLNFDIIYDDDTKNVKPGKGPAPQILQLMGIGFAYSFNNKKP